MERSGPGWTSTSAWLGEGASKATLLPLIISGKLGSGRSHAAGQGLVTQVFFKPHVGIQKSILPATGLVFLRLL